MLGLNSSKDYLTQINLFTTIINYILYEFFTIHLIKTACLQLGDLPDGASTLYDCLDSYTRVSKLEVNNTWTCDKCKTSINPDRNYYCGIVQVLLLYFLKIIQFPVKIILI